jgi:multidrug efflux pump subunit AcrA (membrane-fusion protein)
MDWRAALLSTLSLAVGCSGSHEGSEEAEPVLVHCAPIRSASFQETVRGIGTSTVLPTHKIPVSALLEGMVTEILVQEGERVKPGQPIIRLDDRMAQADLAERKAARAELEASLALLKALPREPERRVLDLEVERGRIAVELARAVLERLEPLHGRKEISDQQLFEAKQKLQDAEILKKAAEARRESVLLGPKPEAVSEMEAKLARAEASLAAASAHLSYFTLAAPRQGTVNSILCRLGQVLPAGVVAAEVVDSSEVLVTFSVPPPTAARLAEGLDAKVSLASSGTSAPEDGTVLAGKVAFVGLEASPETGGFPVRVRLQNPEGRLRLGMMLAVEIVLKTIEGLAVPEEAIVVTEEGPTLFLVREEKAVSLHPRVGWKQSGLVQVTDSGLHAGDVAVTSGAYDLKDGTPVKVESGEKAPAGHEASK